MTVKISENVVILNRTKLADFPATPPCNVEVIFNAIYVIAFTIPIQSFTKGGFKNSKKRVWKNKGNWTNNEDKKRQLVVFFS